MPKKTLKPQSSDNEPAVRAAFITRKGAILTTIITVAGAILVAVIGKWWSEKPDPSSIIEKEKFVGRIIDEATEKSIRQAKVSLESGGVPSVTFTDSEGVFSFPLGNPKKEIYIRVEAAGYKNYDLKIPPLNNEGVQLIRLASSQPDYASPTPSLTSQAISQAPQSSGVTPTPISNSSNRLRDTIQNVQHAPTQKVAREEDGSPRVHGRVIDAETEEPITGVRVYVVGYSEEAITTGSAGEFDLASHKAKNQTLRLRAEKEGYSSKEQWHQAGGQLATIRLTQK